MRFGLDWFGVESLRSGLVRLVELAIPIAIGITMSASMPFQSCLYLFSSIFIFLILGLRWGDKFARMKESMHANVSFFFNVKISMVDSLL